MALVLLLYLASILPMNVAGLALVAVAIGLFIIDVFAPTHGVLTAGGVVAFFLGTFMLFDRGEPFLRLSLAWVVPATVVTAAVLHLRRRRRGPRPAPAGPHRRGDPGGARPSSPWSPSTPAGGRVFLEGEYWRAVSPELVAPGPAGRRSWPGTGLTLTGHAGRCRRRRNTT